MMGNMSCYIWRAVEKAGADRPIDCPTGRKLEVGKDVKGG
jgi:hypothetical protein